MSDKWYDLCLNFEGNRLKHPLVVIDEENFSVDSDKLSDAKRIDNWNPQAAFRSDGPEWDGDPEDFLSNAFRIPIMSTRLRGALLHAGVATHEIQFLPVRIFRSTGEEVFGFEIANVLSSVSALNLEHSTMLEPRDINPQTGKPRYYSYWNAALNGAPLEGHDIVRLTESLTSIFVSERFAKVFNDGMFTGAVLREVEVY